MVNNGWHVQDKFTGAMASRNGGAGEENSRLFVVRQGWIWLVVAIGGCALDDGRGRGFGDNMLTLSIKQGDENAVGMEPQGGELGKGSQRWIRRDEGKTERIITTLL